MKVKYLSIGVFAAIALPLIIQSAFAGSMPQYKPELNAQPESTFTLIRSGRMGRGGGLSVPRAQSMRNFARPRVNAPGAGVPRMNLRGLRVHRGGYRRTPGVGTSRMNLRRMHGMRGHRRGYWRGGQWFWLDFGLGDSCYANCIASGFGPAYCSTYAFNFCD